MASEEQTTTKPASPVHLSHGLTPVMPTGEESTTKPPSLVHLFRGLPTETDSNTPPAPARVVVGTHEAMNNSSGVKSNAEDNANGVHGSTDSSDGSSNQSSENQVTENEEDDANKMVHTPVKRGRGRPPKPKTLLSSEEAVVFGPARQRGRPRKYRDPLSAVSMSPKVCSGRGRGRPRKPLDPFSNDATPSKTGSTISTTKVETKTTTTTTTTKGFSSADASESTTTSTTTESTTTTTVVKTS